LRSAGRFRARPSLALSDRCRVEARSRRSLSTGGALHGFLTVVVVLLVFLRTCFLVSVFVAAPGTTRSLPTPCPTPEPMPRPPLVPIPVFTPPDTPAATPPDTPAATPPDTPAATPPGTPPDTPPRTPLATPAGPMPTATFCAMPVATAA